ncbi:MAG: serine hydrolase [Candidatus Latescibacterota bacterium]|nr:MAG: serine hydrolase [Candidatus Latescibacterota bacterium]
MMEKLDIPGVSVAVVHNGRVEWARTWGVKLAGEVLDPHAMFQAASVSKPVVAMAALSIAAEGKIDLDTDVNHYLSSWKIPENDFTATEKVTLRRLLSHTAGVSSFTVDDGGPAGEAPTLLQILRGEGPTAAGPVTVDMVPGSEHRYSNEGYAIVQQLLIDVERKPFPQIMEERVLNPLEMNHSTFEQPLPAALLAHTASGHTGDGQPVPGRGYVYYNMGAGGLWSTASDLAAFVIEIQRSSAGHSNKVLSQEFTQLMLYDPVSGHGLGLDVSDKAAGASFGHYGHTRGFMCRFIATVEGGDGVVIMSNSNKSIPLMEGIAFAVAKEYGWSDAATPRVIEPYDISTEALEAYTGTYKVGDYPVVIDLVGGRLTISHFEGEDVLLPVSETVFLQQLDGIELTFVKNKLGEIEAVSLMGGRLRLNRVDRIED